MSDNERKDEQFITCLKANESYKNIKAGFEWNDIPRFAVIVGENGSGKTALLEQISLLSKDSEEYSIFQNSLDNKILYYDNITYLIISISFLTCLSISVTNHFSSRKIHKGR